jgi:RecB family exonuclease
VVDLSSFREALVSLACDGDVVDARDRLLVVPTRAAGAQLVRSIERRLLASRGVLVLPDLTTPRELVRCLGDRLPLDRPMLSDAEREVLLGLSCRASRDAGSEPPFHIRPGIVSEMLRFYDNLRRNQKEVDALERLALQRLEPGAEIDRGAARLVRQTRFLVAAFRDFETRCQPIGGDEHAVRERLLLQRAARPVRHIVVAVDDQAFDRYGLCAADWDLLARLPGLDRLDVVVTDLTLAGAAHERMHGLLPGIEEVRFDAGGRVDPVLVVPSERTTVHIARDREEEVAQFARRVKRDGRAGDDLDRMALVVKQPLPYVYVARAVFREAGIPCQMFDALPLAAEPFAAALDLVFAAATAGFARLSSIALLRSSHFRFDGDASEGAWLKDVAALDRALAEAGFLGEPDALEALLRSWRDSPQSRSHTRRAVRCGEALLTVARALAPLRTPAPVADHISVVLEFLARYEAMPDPWPEALQARHLRARAAVLGILRALRDAYGRFDAAPVPFDEVAGLVRRWIESHTFGPRTGDRGVHVVDAESARFGDFDMVQLAGLVDGEWPERPSRNIFYSPDILKELGWASESSRREASRARFADLLRLPSARLLVSTFSLEADVLVSPSPLVDEIEDASLHAVEDMVPAGRIFEHEALSTAPLHIDSLPAVAHEWAAHRQAAGDRIGPRFRGTTGPHVAPSFSLSALERYQDCPFKFFAADVLRLEEEPEDESGLTPRGRGRFIHEVFQRFFEAWDARGGGAITPARIDEARALFTATAEPLLARLSEADSAIERARLFGSAIAVGAVDLFLDIEAVRPADVRERWLEYRLEGEFSLGDASGSRVPLRGVADRIDLLPGRRLRVVDYKSGAAPDARRALQVPVYALCAQERLQERDGAPWTIHSAAYIALSGKRKYVSVVRADADGEAALSAARARLGAVVGGIREGQFPPRPHDPMICRYCAFSSVCRKDYVHDE